MNLPQQYRAETLWYKKATILEIYHLTQVTHDKNWGIRDTAKIFDISIGLVSEDLKLARAIHDDANLITKCKTRKAALAKVKR